MNIQLWSAFVLGVSVTLGLRMLYQAFMGIGVVLLVSLTHTELTIAEVFCPGNA